MKWDGNFPVIWINTCSCQNPYKTLQSGEITVTIYNKHLFCPIISHYEIIWNLPLAFLHLKSRWLLYHFFLLYFSCVYRSEMELRLWFEMNGIYQIKSNLFLFLMSCLLIFFWYALTMKCHEFLEKYIVLNSE